MKKPMRMTAFAPVGYLVRLRSMEDPWTTKDNMSPSTNTFVSHFIGIIESFSL